MSDAEVESPSRKARGCVKQEPDFLAIPLGRPDPDQVK
jgi:hypothetical protein